MPISRNGNGTWPKVDDFHGFMMFNGYINPHVQSFWSLLWSQLSQGLDNRWVAEFVCCFLGGSQSWETHNPRGERQGIWWEAARSAVDVFGGSVEVWNFRIRLIGGTLVPYKAIFLWGSWDGQWSVEDWVCFSHQTWKLHYPLVNCPITNWKITILNG